MLAKVERVPERKKVSEKKTGEAPISRVGWIVFWSTCAYVVAVLALWWMHWSYVDDWWFPTVLSFGPTYLYLAPMVLLVPAGAIWYRRSLWPLAAAALIIVFPIMNLRLGAIAAGPPSSDSQSLRILTCNVFRQKDLARLKTFVETENADLLLLQEAPAEALGILDLGESWHCKQWGELVIASRYPITDSSEHSAPLSSFRQLMLTCEIAMPGRKVRVSCIHFMTLRPGLSAVLERNRNSPQIVTENNAERWSDAIFVGNHLENDKTASILAGDFNTTTEGQILARICPYWHNAFSEVGRGLGWTKRTRWHGVRIDHILASEECRFQDCRVLGDVGSDHRPVVATVWIPPQKAASPEDR
jgi:vancomycin resistance protein VanJ